MSSSTSWPHPRPCQETYSYSNSQPPMGACNLPPICEGTFRLFRFIALYPLPQVLLETFMCPERSSGSNVEARENVAHGKGQSRDGPNCPPYDAISYAWNPCPDEAGQSAMTTQTIQIFVSTISAEINSPIEVLISTHLLHGLITAQELCTPIWLFADAICIDQASIEDKTAQVKTMDRIFRGAERVLIWLGMDMEPGIGLHHRSKSILESHTGRSFSVRSEPALVSETKSGLKESSTAAWNILHFDPDPSLAMIRRSDTESCLDRIPNLIHSLQIYLQSREKSRATECHLSAGAAGLPAPQDPLWKALERLRLNTWFSRLWVIQEVFLARNAVLLYGRHHLSWSVYAELVSLCERVVSNLNSSSQNRKIPELVNCLRGIDNGRVSSIEKLNSSAMPVKLSPSHEKDTVCLNDFGESGETVEALIDLVRRSKVTLELDRVYAILGLLNKKMRKLIRVDYSSESTDQHWVKWIELIQTFLILVPSSAERILAKVSSQEKHPYLPSWCPNLAYADEKCELLHTISSSAGMPKGKQLKSDDLVGSLEVMTKTLEIRLAGFEIDEVVRMVDLSWIEEVPGLSQISEDQNDGLSAEVAQRIILTFWKCLESLTEVGIPSSDSDALLARCLVADAYDEEDVEPAKLLNDYTAFMRYLENHVWGSMSGSSSQKSIESGVLKYGDRCQKMTKKRAFFVSKSGRPGLCPHRAQVGDTVYVFTNYRLPYLLRSNGAEESFEFIGEAYLDGVMHGEALAGLDVELQNPDRFVIR